MTLKPALSKHTNSTKECYCYSYSYVYMKRFERRPAAPLSVGENVANINKRKVVADCTKSSEIRHVNYTTLWSS